MKPKDITYRDDKGVRMEDVLPIYVENRWSSVKKSDLLLKALIHADTLITAWQENRLVGLGTAITDGYLVVYYPHLLILPEYQGRGIGKEIMNRLKEKYKRFHQQMVVADRSAVSFYERCGFKTAGQTQSMWIYDGDDH